MNSKEQKNSKPQRSGNTRGKWSKKDAKTTESRTDSRMNKQRTSAANDPNWYSANGQILKDVASFNFNRPAGERTVLSGSGLDSFDLRMPGIMTIYTMPTVGVSSTNIDPVNKAMQKIYSYVRHANSGHSNYDPVDLMLYLMSMDSVYTYWAYLTRVYGSAMVFSKDNFFVGDAVLSAMGVDPSDIRSHMAEFRAYINMFAVRASTWAVPNVMSYYIRHSWMYSNIYKDEDTQRAQFYMYVPAGLYKYGLDSTGAGMLTFKPLATSYSTTYNQLNRLATPLTLTDLRNYGEELLGAMEGVEDVGIMSGDVLKAYGPENLWKLVQIPETYGVTPIFSEEVLAQIHNTNFAGNVPLALIDSEHSEYAYGTTSLDVRQNTDVGGGNLYFKPYFANAISTAVSKILDLWTDNVTPELSMVASRNMLAGHMSGAVQGSTDTGYAIDSCGSEIALFCVVYSYDKDGVLQQRYAYSAGAWAVLNVTELSRFNEAPHCGIPGPTNSGFTSYFGELNNFAILSNDNVKDIHTAALLSMFNIGNIG